MVVNQNYEQIIMEILGTVIRWTGLVSLPIFLLTVPNSSAVAGTIGGCAESLISSGVGKLPATTACSDAADPIGLADCVAEIESETGLEGNDVLQSCYRVRRPQDLASCVSTISSELELDRSPVALDTCRRSLLPKRHAECTLDLASVGEVEVEEAMESCIAAQITPSEVAPARE